MESVEENLLSVDVRYLGNGDIINELHVFELRARLYDKDYNSFVNEKPLNLLVKRIEVLKTEVSKTWNSNLSKPLTPTKDFVFKRITPIEKRRLPIKCSLCLEKITYLKSKKGYKNHLAKFHKNERQPDMKAVPEDPEVHCMLEKKGVRCTKSYDLDQIYR